MLRTGLPATVIPPEGLANGKLFVDSRGITMLTGPKGAQLSDCRGRRVDKRSILRPPSFGEARWSLETPKERREAWDRY